MKRLTQKAMILKILNDSETPLSSALIWQHLEANGYRTQLNTMRTVLSQQADAGFIRNNGISSCNECGCGFTTFQLTPLGKQAANQNESDK